MDKDFMEEDIWDVPPDARRRALFRIYGMGMIIMGLMFAFMGLHLSLLNGDVVLGAEEEAIPVTISYIPPEDTALAKTVMPCFTVTDQLRWQGSEEETEVEEVEAEPPDEPDVYVYYNVPLSDEIQRYTQDLCDAYGVKYIHALAMMKQESDFTATAFSQQNANGTHDWGIMQINSGNHEWLEKELGITDWLDIRQNIYAGVYILSLYSYHGNNFQAIAMFYNSGPTKGQSNYNAGYYTNYSYEAMNEYMRLEAQNENLRTEER